MIDKPATAGFARAALHRAQQQRKLAHASNEDSHKVGPQPLTGPVGPHTAPVAWIRKKTPSA